MGDRNLGDRIDVEYERLVKGGALASSSSQTIFDVVAIQFALHYACGEVERVQRTLATAAKRLASDGTGLMLVTLVDRRKLLQHVTTHAGGEHSSVSFGNDIFEVCIPPPAAQALCAGEKMWGIEYLFSLGDAVQRCPEFAVDLAALRAVALEEGLELVHAQGLGGFVADSLQEERESSNGGRRERKG